MAFTGSLEQSMQVVAAAVTPVVMVSATAILISGVNTRYMSIADRIRSLTHEFRSGCTPERQRVIQLQMRVFKVRLALASWANRLLYTSVGVFVTVALLISITYWQKILEFVTLPLFLFGLVLLMVAIVCELLELKHSNYTIRLEFEDVLPPLQ